jgi:hypothetical protein
MGLMRKKLKKHVLLCVIMMVCTFDTTLTPEVELSNTFVEDLKKIAELTML